MINNQAILNSNLDIIYSFEINSARKSRVDNITLFILFFNILVNIFIVIIKETKKNVVRLKNVIILGYCKIQFLYYIPPTLDNHSILNIY